MAEKPLTRFVSVLALVVLAAGPLHADHVARRLGHPSTRFADPVRTPEELRDRLTCAKLRADVVVILELCDGWQGDAADFRQAAATAPIKALQIPVGARLPAMSARKNGKPILIRNLVWGGEAPIDAYEFFFHSNGRRYRCVTPKACCNFWVENIGPDRRVAVLKLDCDVPQELVPARPARVCLTLDNTGNATDELVTVALPVPAGARFVSASGEVNPNASRLVWRIPQLAPGTGKLLCADFIALQPGPLAFSATAHATTAESVETQCVTHVTGIAAILLEVIDLADPIEVGQPQTYEISVTNQGSAPLTTVNLVCTLEDSQEFVSGSGATAVQGQERTVTLAPLAELAPKATAKWQVVVKAVKAGDVRFATDLTSDQFVRPIKETEATRQY